MRRALRPDDLAALAAALRSAEHPPPVFRLMESLSGDLIGHRLFTIMRFDSDRDEVERVHTSMPAIYPVGGRKSKKDTAWSDHVLHEMRVYRGNTPDDIRAAFDDHATIASLGLSSILNIPLVLAGRCLGTMNLSHEAGWYAAEDEAMGLVLGAFLLPVL